MRIGLSVLLLVALALWVYRAPLLLKLHVFRLTLGLRMQGHQRAALKAKTWRPAGPVDQKELERVRRAFISRFPG